MRMKRTERNLIAIDSACKNVESMLADEYVDNEVKFWLIDECINFINDYEAGFGAYIKKVFELINKRANEIDALEVEDSEAINQKLKLFDECFNSTNGIIKELVVEMNKMEDIFYKRHKKIKVFVDELYEEIDYYMDDDEEIDDEDDYLLELIELGKKSISLLHTLKKKRIAKETKWLKLIERLGGKTQALVDKKRAELRDQLRKQCSKEAS